MWYSNNHFANKGTQEKNLTKHKWYGHGVSKNKCFYFFKLNTIAHSHILNYKHLIHMTSTKYAIFYSLSLKSLPHIISRINLSVIGFSTVWQLFLLFNKFNNNRGYLSPIGEANGSSYESLGQQSTVHVYSTMQNRDLFDHGSNYEALGQGTVHMYSTMQNNDVFGHGSN